MSVSHNIFAFTAGEVSPQFYNRTDLTKYALGLAECTNFFVNYEGGISNRPGSQFIATSDEANEAVRMFRFRATGNDFVVIAEDARLRFMRDGGYLIDTASTFNVTGLTTGANTEITIDITGASSGDLWNLNDQIFIDSPFGDITPAELDATYFLVGSTSTVGNVMTVQLKWPDGRVIDSSDWDALTGSPTAGRVQTIVTEWGGAELSLLRMTQNKNEAYFTHQDNPPMVLTYDTASDSFTLATLTATDTLDPPGGLTITAASGSAGILATITAIDADGQESIGARPASQPGIVNYASTAGSASFTWNQVAGAQYYNVYRSLIQPDGTTINFAATMGFIGSANGPSFTDNNIIPDFTKTPPAHSDPFTSGGIIQLSVTAGGSGYNNGSQISVSDSTGTGFVAYPVVSGGIVRSVIIVDPGSGYTNPSFSITDGSGATFGGVVLSPTTGNYPAVSARFQQRVVYAGTVNNPDTLWGTKPGTRYNFDVTVPPIATDAYTFTLDSPDVNPIRHMIALRQGLLLFTNYGVFQLRAATGDGVSATNALTDVQGYKSVSSVEPLAVDLNVLFTQEEGSAIYSMNYTYYSESFQLQDITVLAAHLFTRERMVERMQFLEEPNKLVYCNQADGRRAVCTYEPEQEVIAWTVDETKGMYRDSVVVMEGNRFTMYQVVDRLINNNWERFIERQFYRDFRHSDEAQFLDAALVYPGVSESLDLTFTASSGTGAFATSNGPLWTSAFIGRIIYAGGGKFEITAVNSDTIVQGNWLRPMTDTIPQSDGTPIRIGRNSWQYFIPVSSVGGLQHLETETVVALADGDYIPDLVVTDGRVTLPREYTRIIVGIPYTARAKGLPPSSQSLILDDKRKTFQGAAVATNETRGLSMGTDEGGLYEIPNRTYEEWGEPIRSLADRRYSVVSDGWSKTAQMVFEQTYPLPATVLGFASLIEIGDDA